MQTDIDSLRRFITNTPFMVDLGVDVLGGEPGRVQTEIVLQPRHLQHTGVVHAGVLAALADHTMGTAAQTLASDEVWVLTAEFKINLLRGARGERLVCEAWVIKPGRQLSFTEAEVYAIDAAGERQLCVKASGTMALTARR